MSQIVEPGSIDHYPKLVTCDKCLCKFRPLFKLVQTKTVYPENDDVPPKESIVRYITCPTDKCNNEVIVEHYVGKAPKSKYGGACFCTLS